MTWGRKAQILHQPHDILDPYGSMIPWQQQNAIDSYAIGRKPPQSTKDGACDAT